MAQRPSMVLSGVVLDAPDAQEFCAFYQRLLGWPVIQDEPGWMKLGSPEGGSGLSFQTEPDYRRPTWPAGPGDQQMSIHLDIKVTDLAAAGAHAIAAGAVLAEYQPQRDV